MHACTCLVASEGECKSDVEDVEQSEAKTSERDQVAENMHVSTPLILSAVNLWETLPRSLGNWAG